MMNQKTGVMVISGIVAAVTSIVFTGSAMNLIGVRRANATLDPVVAGNQPTPPAPVKKADTKAKAEKPEQTVETEL